MKKYRIVEEKRINDSKFWIQESFSIFGLHLYWIKIDYTFSLKYTLERLENMINKSSEKVLGEINTSKPNYQEQIDRLKRL